MKLWTLAVAGLVIAGCGPSSRVAQIKGEPGPSVDISVEPLRVGNGKAPKPSATTRAQRIYASSADRSVPSPDEVKPARSTREVSSTQEPQEERPKPRRRKRRRTVEPTEVHDRPRVAAPRREKGFEDLSAEERRKIIEGG